MQLIQKMILMLLAVALLPVFLVGTLVYLNTATSLRDRELNRLEAIASIQQTRIERLISQNETLITSYAARAGLRANLDRYNQFGRPADRDLVQASVATMLTTDKAFRAVSILNPAGKVVASTDAASIGQSKAQTQSYEHGRMDVDVTSCIGRTPDGGLSLYLTGPLKLDGRLIGVAVIESDMSSLLDLATTYTGLGTTGETLLARRNLDGTLSYLLPLRFDKAAALHPRSAVAGDRAVSRALDQQVGTFADTVDYRNQKVLAATRYVAAAGWGLVVKVDQSEAYAPLTQLTNLLLVVIFMLSVVIIFLAFYLARRLNEPILNLAIAADRVRGGDLTARASIGSRDEVGQLAETFNAMVENVAKTDQMKSEFVLLTSHQLRTPATAVKGFISMLLDGYAGQMSAKQTQLVTAAYSENERQISVINSILDVARMEAGEMVLERRTCDVREIVAASAEGQAPMLKAHQQTVEIVQPDKPVELWVDPTKLQLVIDNFIHNAIKYSPPQTKITVELQPGRRQTVIEIRDQGFGIARRDLPRLFKRFSRISGPHTANVQGAGLGLYLAEKLVTMHGGTIRVHSREGVGTRFVITLPNVKDADK